MPAKLLRLGLVAASVLLFGCATFSGGIELRGGQLVVSEDTAFTKINHLRGHGRTVVLIGTLHYAPRDYFDKILGVLNSCEYSIIEGSAPAVEKNHQVSESAWRDMLFDEDSNEAFLGALNAPPPDRAMEKFGFIFEFTFFQENWKPNWISGDGVWYGMQNEFKWEPFWSTQRKLVPKIPKDIKDKIVHERRRLSLASDSNALTRKDMVRYLALVFGTYGEFTSPVFDSFTKVRDELAMSVLDNLIGTKNPQKVCIKFGAYHMPYQRELLERRGYVLQHSEELNVFGPD